MNKYKKNNTSKISLCLDQDLAKIIKNNQVNLNEELQKFFEYKYENSYKDIEVTLDSYSEIQNIIKFLSEFNNDLTKLSKWVQISSTFGRLIINFSFIEKYDNKVSI